MRQLHTLATCLTVTCLAVAAEGNLLKNGAFELGAGNLPAEWQTQAWKGAEAMFTWENSGGTGGSRCISIEATADNDARFEQKVVLAPHTAYLLRGMARGEGIKLGKDAWVGANLCAYGIYRCSSDTKISKGTFDWTPFEVDFATGPKGEATVAARLGHWSSTVTGKVYFDDLELMADARVERRESKHLYMNLWKKDWANFEDGKAERWLAHLDAAYEAMADLTGYQPYGGGKIGISTPTWFPGGWAVAGNPIRWRRRYVRSVLVGSNKDDNWGFGVLHEMGHDFDHGSAWNFDAEFWANFKLHYAVETLDGKLTGPQGLATGKEFRLFWKEKFEQQWGKKKNAHNDGLQHKMLLMQSKIGWEPFKQTFRSFWALPADQRPKSRWAKFQAFNDFLAKHSGEDVWAFYTPDELERLKQRYSAK